MMPIRFFLLFFALTTFAIPANAQDMIVTVNRDSLNCKLGKLEDNQYPITFYNGYKKLDGHIHRDSIIYMRRNMFRSLRNNRLMPWYPLKEFGIDGGVIHQIGTFRIDDDLTDKSDFAARTGFYLGADVSFFSSKTMGYGLKYNFRSLLGGDVIYQHIAPMLGVRFWDSDRRNNWFLQASFGLGWMRQRNAPVQVQLSRPRIKMTAMAYSGDLGVGYNLRVSPNVSVRFKLSANLAYPGFVKIADIGKYSPNSLTYSFDLGDYCKNMNSVNFTVGFTFNTTKPLD